MSPQQLLDIALVIAALCFIAVRQYRWQSVDAAKLLRAPLVLGVIGVVLTAQGTQSPGTAEIAALVLQLVVGLGSGALMGAVSSLRRNDSDATTAYSARPGGRGLAILGLLIAVRVGLGFLLAALGLHAAMATGTILLMIAANRAGWGLVLRQRTQPRPLAVG